MVINFESIKKRKSVLFSLWWGEPVLKMWLWGLYIAGSNPTQKKVCWSQRILFNVCAKRSYLQPVTILDLPWAGIKRRPWQWVHWILDTKPPGTHVFRSLLSELQISGEKMPLWRSGLDFVTLDKCIWH